MAYHRRKGVVIVDTHKGILLVAGKGKIFSLPGGGAGRGESRRKAAIRELKEETGLNTESAKHLLSYIGDKWYNKKGSIRNYTKVFVVKADGHAKPRHEIRHVDYWKIGSNLRISRRTKWIINKYKDGDKKSIIDWSNSEEVKRYNKEYRSRPCVKAKRKIYNKSPERRANKREYNQRPEVKAKREAGQQTPEFKAKRRIYNQKSNVKVKRRERDQRPKYKEKRKIYSKKPEQKLKNRKYRLTPKAIETKKAYYKRPHVKDAYRRRNKIPEVSVKRKLRARVRLSLKEYTEEGKIKSSDEYDINYKKIIEHLEPFPEDQSEYHIDHIKPLCKFNFVNEDGTQNLEEIKEAFAPNNHQWLLAYDNLSKGGKWDDEATTM